MLRIQLVIEDYGDLIELQTLLKKVGFDVDASQSSVGLTDQLLNFNPDVIVMNGFGRKVGGLEIARGLKRTRDLPHVILFHEVSRTVDDDPAVTAWLPLPIDAFRLLKVIAEKAQLNQTILLEKYKRFAKNPNAETMGDSNPAEDPVATPDSPAGSRIPESTLPDEERRARYAKFLKSEVPARHGFTAQLVRDQVKDLRKKETSADAGDLERERRDFVAQLFKKRG